MTQIKLPVKVEQEIDLAIRRAKTKRKILHSSRHLEYVLEDCGIDWAESLIAEDMCQVLTESLTPEAAQRFLEKLQKKAFPKSIWKLSIDPYLVQNRRLNRVVMIFEFVRRNGES